MKKQYTKEKRKLTERSADQSGDIIYGINPIVEALKAKRRRVMMIYTTKPAPQGWSKIEQHIAGRSVRVQQVDRAQLTSLSATDEHQGVAALVQPFVYTTVPFDAQKYPFILMLDGIQDPRNLGALLRSAYCTGVSGIVLTKKSSAPINAVVMKTSAGLAEYLPIYRAASISTAVQEIKKAGYTIYVTAFDGKFPEEYDLKEPICVVIGSEGSGVSREMLTAGPHITLPQKEGDISYNASVAAGILLFLVARKNGRI